MANKYCNLQGSQKISESYININTGFDAIEADINAIEADINALDSRVNTIITTPIDGEAAAQELVDARAGFSTIGGRMTNIEEDIETHKADNTPHREAVSIERKNPDDDGIFTLIEFKRADGTLFKTSQLNGTSPYNSRTVKYYDKNGNLIQTVEYSITYSNDEMVSEVIISA